jgi:ribonuclease T2
MTYFLLFCLLLSHTEAKSIPQPPPAPSPDHFPLDSWPKDSLLPRHRCPPPAQRDHFWLVHTWPMGFCSNHSVNCAQPYLRDKLTIHGWWPVNKTDRTMNNNVPARLHKKNHLVTHSHVICYF